MDKFTLFSLTDYYLLYKNDELLDYNDDIYLPYHLPYNTPIEFNHLDSEGTSLDEYVVYGDFPETLEEAMALHNDLD